MSDSLVDRTTEYVRGHPLLRVLFGLTLANYAATALLAAGARLNWQFAGYLVLLSVLTWFFAVGIPMMNRANRESLGADPIGYWGGIVEVFARVVLCAQTGLYSALLVYAAFGISV